MITSRRHSLRTPPVIGGLQVAALAGLFGLLALDQRPPSDLASPGSVAAEAARAELSAVSQAMFSWLTDQVGVFPGGRSVLSRGVTNCLIDLAEYPAIDHATLESLLVPSYIASLPELDPWGNPYDYRLNVGNLPDSRLIALRSAGADGIFEGNVYAFQTTAGPDDDLVVADGLFARDLPRLDPISRQESSTEDMRILGGAWLGWLADNLSRGPAIRPPLLQNGSVDLTELEPVTYDALVGMLVPSPTFFYTRCVPRFDGWGHAYDFFLNNNLLAANVLAIRSPGADGVAEGDVYVVGTFPADDFDRDTVWANGLFAQISDGNHDLVFSDAFETGGVWGTWSECSTSP